MASRNDKLTTRGTLQGLTEPFRPLRQSETHSGSCAPFLRAGKLRRLKTKSLLIPETRTTEVSDTKARAQAAPQPNADGTPATVRSALPVS